MSTPPARVLLSLMAGGYVASVTAQPAAACSIPVSQYALMYWESDVYEFAVFHRGPLSPEDEAVIDQLKSWSWRGDGYGNHAVRVIDLEGEVEETDQRLFDEVSATELPWMVLRGRMGWQRVETVWSGPLSESAARELMDSPLRREIAQRIGQGQAAVWIFLEGGQRAEDDRAYELLGTELKKLETELSLPMIPTLGGPEADQETVDEDDTPRISFSALRLSRDDPAERLLVSLLLKTEDDLTTLSGPMAFPVFGRGRVLYALVGPGINERNIMEACAFLVEGCSCQVKAMNPGVDLLMMADWVGLIEGQAEDIWAGWPTPGLTDEKGLVQAGNVGTGEEFRGVFVRNSVLGVAGGVVLVGLIAWLLSVRDRKARFVDR